MIFTSFFGNILFLLCTNKLSSLERNEKIQVLSKSKTISNLLSFPLIFFSIFIFSIFILLISLIKLFIHFFVSLYKTLYDIIFFNWIKLSWIFLSLKLDILGSIFMNFSFFLIFCFSFSFSLLILFFWLDSFFYLIWFLQ